jgi:peptide/nickel transport system permease protein
VLAFVLRRLAQAVLVMLAVGLIAFSLFRFVGDPVVFMLGQDATDEQRQEITRALGLDRPFYIQYLNFLRHAAQGEFGLSLRQVQPVSKLILGRLPATLELVAIAILIAIVLGAGLALLGAYFRRRLPEWLVDGFVALSLAIPDFLWGLLFILAFGVLWPVMPISGRIDPRLGAEFHTGFYLVEALISGRWALAGDLIRHAILPAVALALPLAAIVTRVFKTSLGEAELQDYAQVARARGLSRGRVLVREAMPNAAISTVTLAGVQVTFLIGGTVLVERIFSYEGIGNMAIDAMINRDLPLIQGLVLTFAAIFIAINLAIDLITAWLDPRVHHG